MDGGRRTRGREGDRATLLVPFVREHVSLLECSQRRVYCIGLLWLGTTYYRHTIMVYELYGVSVLVNRYDSAIIRPGQTRRWYHREVAHVHRRAEQQGLEELR